jgi:DNA-binding NarL/FixJ family response regulator
MQAAVRTALISSSPLVLAGLKAALEQRGDFDIVLAQDAAQAVADASFARAQVGIVDIATDADFQPVAAVADEGPPLLLLWPERDGPLAEWLGSGHSLLPRDAPIEWIATAAQAAAVGLVASTPQLTAEALRATSGADRRTFAEAGEALTPREREVLLQMSLGLGNREIAEALHISAHTAKFHVAQIIAKLDASSRTHAVAKGLRSGLVEL